MKTKSAHSPTQNNPNNQDRSPQPDTPQADPQDGPAAPESGETFPPDEACSSIDTIVKILTSKEPLTGSWQEVFLATLAKAPFVSAAAGVAGVSPKQAMDERDADQEFAERWNRALEHGIDEIEAAAYLSGVFGDRKPVFQRGLQVGWHATYAHPMRTMLLKARRPQVFAKKIDPKHRETMPMTLEEFRQRVEEARRG